MQHPQVSVLWKILAQPEPARHPRHLYVTLQVCDWEPEQLTCPADSISKMLQVCLKCSQGLGSCLVILFLQTAHCL